MITQERIGAYIDSLSCSNTPFLNRLESEALENGIPVIKRPTQSLIRLLLGISAPETILEVGTAVGFSAILMATYAPKNCRITTIEKYEKRIPAAKENFERSGFADRITLLEGDAAQILEELSKDHTYDMIFMDAAKGQYMGFYPYVKAMMRDGSILVSDNVLQDGDIAESRFAVTRRNRTI
ncbi:MAG: O-methyltransferase, partial [Lachnospiraceae bacterium]|nr:O-methyltransferase [Lachnospiraceae bacterium]